MTIEFDKNRSYIDHDYTSFLKGLKIGWGKKDGK
jgi:hypothetical protein